METPEFAEGSGSTWTWNSVSTTLPLAARPGPELGSDLSGRASTRNPEMPFSSVWTTIVYRQRLGTGPPARIDPSSSGVSVTPSVADMRLGARRVQFIGPATNGIMPSFGAGAAGAGAGAIG